MGNSYSIFRDIPPSIGFLNNQQQQLTASVKLIVLIYDATANADNYCPPYRNRFSNLTAVLKNRGFLVLTIRRNIEGPKMIRDPYNGLLQLMTKEVRTIQQEFYTKSITLEISDTMIVAYGSMSNVLVKAFDRTDYEGRNRQLYSKIRSAKQRSTAMINNTEPSHLIMHEHLMSIITSIVLLNPDPLDVLNKGIRIDKSAYVMCSRDYVFEHTDDHDHGHHDNPSNAYSKICYGGFRADRIENMDDRNMQESKIGSDKLGTLVDHLIDVAYGKV